MEIFSILHATNHHLLPTSLLIHGLKEGHVQKGDFPILPLFPSFQCCYNIRNIIHLPFGYNIFAKYPGKTEI